LLPSLIYLSSSVWVRRANRSPQCKQKAIDPLITDRFDILLAERDNPPAPPVVEEVYPQHIGQLPGNDSNGGNFHIKPEVKDEETEEGMSPPDMKRKSSSVDEDARLAAELHAELNGGRPVRGGAAKPKKAGTVKGKRATAKKKSKDIVDSDLSGAEEPVKKKRKANPNNAFMRPLVLSAPLAAFIGEPQVCSYGCLHDTGAPN
jgi:upstream activation factor subunit UAF30